MESDENREAHPVKNRAAYQAPTLKLFGSIKTLTASGSGNDQEQSTGGGGCDSSKSKFSCL